MRLLKTAISDFAATIAFKENRRSLERLMLADKMKEIGGLQGEMDELDAKLQQMQFGAEGTDEDGDGGNGDDDGGDSEKVSKFNHMWLSGLTWQQQSENYIAALEQLAKPRATTKRLARLHTTAQRARSGRGAATPPPVPNQHGQSVIGLLVLVGIVVCSTCIQTK